MNGRPQSEEGHKRPYSIALRYNFKDLRGRQSDTGDEHTLEIWAANGMDLSEKDHDFSSSSKDIVPLKSEEISSGVLLSVTICSIPALIAASIPWHSILTVYHICYIESLLKHNEEM